MQHMTCVNQIDSTRVYVSILCVVQAIICSMCIMMRVCICEHTRKFKFYPFVCIIAFTSVNMSIYTPKGYDHNKSVQPQLC